MMVAIFSANVNATEISSPTSEGLARNILEKMSSATHKLNYDGVFVYSRGNQLDSMRIIHKVGEQGEIERLISLTGANREVVKNNKDVTCIYSDNQTVMVNKGGSNKFLASNLPESIARISAYYHFRVLGEDRVVGRATDIIEIMPKDDYRYTYHFWVDRETHLMLKSTIVNMQGKTLETVLFTQIDFPHEITNDVMTPMNTTNYSWHTNEEKQNLTSQDESQWEIQWLPDGFTMESTNEQFFAEKKQPLEHLVYSDGLATVSLYIEKIDKDKQPMNGYVSLGAVNAYTAPKEGFQVTVVGELPAISVHKIASSVTRKSTDHNKKVLP